MRKAWLVVVAVLGMSLGCGKKAPSDLKASGSPTGEVNGKMHVSVSFTRAMVGSDAVGKPATAAPIKIEPDLPGETSWADDKTIVVWPKSSLPISTKYTVTVPKGTKALDGNELDDDFTFDFFTTRLTANIDVLGSADRAAKDVMIRLYFNQPVPLEQVLAHCKFTSPSGDVTMKNGPESPSGPAQQYTLAATKELTLDTAYVFTCDTDMRGVVGNVGLEKAAEEKVHTYGPLHFVKLAQAGKDIQPSEDTRLSLQFTNPLASPYLMTIKPEVQGFPDNCHDLDGDAPGLSCSVALDPQTTYTIAIDAKQTDSFGQALGKPETLTFHTTDAKPAISLETGYFIAELKRPVLPVWARNVKSIDVTAVPLTQESFAQIRPLLSWWDNNAIDFSKTKLAPQTKKIDVTGTRNKWSQHPLGAADLFAGGVTGPGMFYVEIGSEEINPPKKPAKGSAGSAGSAADDSSDDNNGDDGPKLYKTLVNFTDIGVVSKLSPSRGLVWAAKLSTGKPLPGATVTVRDETGKVKFTATTDADGVAMLPGTSQLLAGKTKPKKHAAPTDGTLDPNGEHYSEERGGATDDSGNGDDQGLNAYRIFVQAGPDWTMINPTRTNGLSPWSFNVSVDSDTAPVKLRGFMHTDRGLYKPGETVHVKGLARISKLVDPLDVPGEGKKVAVTVTNPQGKTFQSVDAKLSAFGGFWFDLNLPGDARLGDYSIEAKLDAGTFTQSFTVQEYKPATFEVTGKAKEGKLVKEGTVHATVSGNYYYGSPVRGGDVQVTVLSRTRYVSFPGFEDYTFSDDRRSDYTYESSGTQQMVTENQAKLDDKGNATVEIPITPNDISHDADLLISTAVTDPSNEVENHSFSVPYYAAKTYLGVKSPSYFFSVGETNKLQLVAVTSEGKPAKAQAKVTIERRGWDCVWEDWGYRGNYNCKENNKVVLDKTVQVDGAAPAEIEFKPETGGEYVLEVKGTNDKLAISSASLGLYAYGDGGGSWKSDDTETLEIVADKKEYKAGDTATLLLKTDLAQATGLVTIERDGVVEKHTVQISKKVKHISVPITGAYAPNVYVSVALVQGRIGEGTRGKPRMRMGYIDLPVHPDDNKLTIAIATDKPDYRPGETVTATVTVTDAAGKPVQSEVSVAAADEGVLALMGYETPNPLPTFYASWGLGVSTATQLEYLRDIPGANQDRPAFGGDSAGTVRSHFVSTAVWTPNAITDPATGTATITFTAPDNLTAFRLMALAADKGHKFGSADKRFTVSKPLQLLTSLPRFADVGDTLQGGVVVHNDTQAAGTATVKIVADNHFTVGGDATRAVDVPAGGRVAVLWPLTANVAGDGSLEFSVTMGDNNDALKLPLHVKQPSPERVKEVATGLAKGDTKVKVPLPKDAEGGTVELEVSVDPFGLAGIDRGLRELVHYPYGCLEQTTSQLIPMIAAKSLAESLAIDGLKGPALDGYVKAGITKIGLHQTPYGGFSLWPGGEAEPYYTAYALWGLWFAKGGGYGIDQSRVDDGLEYLRNDGQSPDQSRPHYNDTGNLGSQAFAVYVRTLFGDKTAAAAATKLNDDAAKLPIYGKAFLARALAKTLPGGAKDPAVQKLVTELEGQANAAAQKDELISEPQQRYLWSYMSSDVRTTAIVLDALVELDPKTDAVPKLVRVVMANRNKPDYYGDTQSDLYSIVALSNYAGVVGGKKTGTVDVKWGGGPMIHSSLATMRVESRSVVIDAKGGKLPAETEVEIAPSDGAEVYYNVGVRYRQTIQTTTAEANGLLLALEYLDESGKPKSSFKVGDIVRVRATTTVKEDADHMMVSVSLPAGFEAINTRFVTGANTTVVPQNSEWGAYEELHDDRVDYASEYNSGGQYVHEFLMRAATAGKFIRPPTVAELMYQPKTTARTGADTIEIKGK